MMRFKHVLLGLLALMLAGCFYLGFSVWRGSPLKTDPAPAPVPGTVYYLQRDTDQLLKVMQQPADLSSPPIKVAAHENCGEENCNITDLRLVDGALEYGATYKGELHWWRGGKPIAVMGKEEPMPDKHVGAENKRGSLMVDGKEVLHYAGRYDFKWASGYDPVAWIGGGRYLVFSYSGYENPDIAFLGGLMGRQNGGNYLWDRETGKVYPFVDGYDVIWQP